MKPDPMYVANPKKGSMHNMGLTVDLSIVDKNGKELDMGTPYDSSIKKHILIIKNFRIRL